VPVDLHHLSPGLLTFLTERHLATLTTLRPDGTPHVVPVGFTFDPETRTARVITSGTSAKAGHVRGGSARVAVCSHSVGIDSPGFPNVMKGATSTPPGNRWAASRCNACVTNAGSMINWSVLDGMMIVRY